MNDEKVSATLFDHTRDITALQESVKSAHKRIDKMDKLTEAVHELTRSNTAIATEVRTLVEKFDKTTDRIEKGQKSQGERVGAIERVLEQVKQNEKEIADMSEKLDAVRMEPGERWKYLVMALIGGILAAILGAVSGIFFYN